MATLLFTSSLLSIHRQVSLLSRSLSSSAPASAPFSPLSLPSDLRHHLRPLSAASAEFRRRVALASSARSFATRSTSSSINNPNPKLWNRPPKETILLDGCDIDSWVVVMEQPEGDPTRHEIMDSYFKTLAQVVESEAAAKKSMYLASTGKYFWDLEPIFLELNGLFLTKVSRLMIINKHCMRVSNYSSEFEPFINEQAVPYHPKYYEGWLRNNARVTERNGRKDGTRNFDRLRHHLQVRDMLPPMHSQGMQNPPPQGNMPPPTMGGGMPPTSKPWQNACTTKVECPKAAMVDLFVAHCSPPPNLNKTIYLHNLEHLVVLMKMAKGFPTKDEIINSYIQTLAQVETGAGFINLILF
ncbi:multiple organellar RNA editing factor 8, chloroplastic/mitochondrial-like [Rhodamnia argentea]|uniref:Multiple organellar RNA editing factor 8, chloroplastic/mitochondrial-like n=1 Tax=Rhodamnia argentea TaxID=178133 RepID=A0ABM3HCL3_9MYRT|nr:multiple organellar RNA editing factor 8, chloroplastic/mitochondrial-like [Rhodamnia argentea]